MKKRVDESSHGESSSARCQPPYRADLRPQIKEPVNVPLILLNGSNVIGGTPESGLIVKVGFNIVCGNVSTLVNNR